jgi:HK97 family phage portal protein
MPTTIFSPAATKSLTTISPTGQDSIRALFGLQDEAVSSVETLYREVGTFRRAAKIRAQAVSDVPWAVYRRGADKAVWNNESTSPAPPQLGVIAYLPAIMRKAALAYQLVGSVLYKKEVVGNRIASLSYLSPGACTIFFQDGRLYKVQYMPQGGYGVAGTFAPDQLAWTFDDDPFYEIGNGGSGDGGSGARSGSVKRSLEQFATNFLASGAVRATMIKVAPHTSQDERARLKSWFQAVFGGARNSGTVEAVSKDTEFQTVGDGVKDLEYGEVSRDQKESICEALGVPPSLLLANAANYATALSHELTFLRYTVVPDANAIADMLNVHVLEPMGYKLQIEEYRMDAFQAAQFEQAQSVRNLVGAPTITKEEARELMGYEPVPKLGTLIEPMTALQRTDTIRASMKRFDAAFAETDYK